MNELFIPDREIRIQELSVEAPTAEFERAFDPERDISQSDWEKIRKEVENLASMPAVIRPYAEMLADVLRLFPDRRDQFPISPAFTEKIKEALADEIQLYNENGYNFFMLMKQLGAIRVIMGDQLIDPDLYTHIHEDILDMTYGSSRNAIDNLQELAYASRAFPQQVIPLAEGVLSQHQDAYEHKLRAFAQDPEQFLDPCTEMAVYCRTVHPNHLDAFPVPPDFWERARADLSDLRNSVSSFVMKAVELKMLAAEKITVDAYGLHAIVPHHITTSPEAQLPEQKRYQ